MLEKLDYKTCKDGSAANLTLAEHLLCVTRTAQSSQKELYREIWPEVRFGFRNVHTPKNPSKFTNP